MCTYCYIGDHAFRFNPPWDVWVNVPPTPYIPPPVFTGAPINPWPLERLKEYLEILKQVKALEDQVGCPCEPNKADYIKLFEERVSKLEKELIQKERREMS